jgi:Avidin family
MKHGKALARSVTRTTAAPNFGGRWINELNSKMTLKVQGVKISGTYTSAVSGGGGSVSGKLSGYVNGNMISFVVNWPSSITAWVMSRIQATLPNFGNPYSPALISFIARPWGRRMG